MNIRMENNRPATHVLCNLQNERAISAATEKNMVSPTGVKRPFGIALYGALVELFGESLAQAMNDGITFVNEDTGESA